MRKGVVNHQVIDVVVGDAGLGKGLGAGDAERARGGEIFHCRAVADMDHNTAMSTGLI
jgi:hypothetical protein